MSEQSTAYYRESTAPRAISTSQLLGQVMFLVAIALAFCAAGTLLGRDLSLGTARICSFAGFGMLLVSSFAGERFRIGPFAMVWLFATALMIGLGLGPIIDYYLRPMPPRLTQAFVGTAATVAARRLARLRDLEGPRAVDAAGRDDRFRRRHRDDHLVAVRRHPQPGRERGIYLVSALLIVIDFNYIRKHATENDAIWLATGIFVSIVNIFLSLLNIFSSR